MAQTEMRKKEAADKQVRVNAKSAANDERAESGRVKFMEFVANASLLLSATDCTLIS